MTDYKQLAVAFNTARVECTGDVFNRSEMYKMLTEVIGFGRDSALLTLLVNKGILRYMGRNMYAFPLTPVYYGKLQVVMTMHHHNLYLKYNKWTPERATKYLKDRGYIVYPKHVN